MKNLLSGILLFILMAILTAGFFVYDRYQKNPEQIVPFPYTFAYQPPEVQLSAPILITGDRMGAYFARFSTGLAEQISVNLDKPIKIQSMAKEGLGLHRTLHEMRGITQWPQIVLYQGGSEEFFEEKFPLEEISLIRKNFSLYNDDRVETLLILYPLLSRLIYDPMKRLTLQEKTELVSVDEKSYLDRLETELLLYEQHLLQLVKLSQDRNSLLILMTTPINLDEPPRKVCSMTTTLEIETEVLELRRLLKENNPKEAYKRSSEMIQKFVGNAEVYFIHGQIAKRVGKTEEAVETLLKASAYDCDPWRATEVINSIIRKVARENRVLLFDFAKFVQQDFGQGPTFFDELHPQNLYYDRGVQELGLVIKNILKL